MNIVGKWRITEMETWKHDAIDLVGPAFIEFAGQGGQLHFIVVPRISVRTKRGSR